MQADIETSALALSIRLIQGYRYLDRCGEALIRIEETLGPNWITGEVTPAGGNIKNEVLGMNAVFDARTMNVAQREVVSFEHFVEETLKIYQIVCEEFKILKINAPAFSVIFQKAFDSTEEANEYLLRLSVCTPAPPLMSSMRGDPEAVSLVLTTVAKDLQDGIPGRIRRRLSVNGVIQAAAPSFDDRMLQRSHLLSQREQSAFAAVIQMRAVDSMKKMHPKTPANAVHFNAEQTNETEIETRNFDLFRFLTDSWAWANELKHTIQQMERKRV